MSTVKTNWSIHLTLIVGLLLGVALKWGLDQGFPKAIAEESVGKRAASEQAETFRNASRVIAPAVVAITSLQRVRFQEGGGKSTRSRLKLPRLS